VAGDIQSKASKIKHANQREKLIERLQVKESKWRYRLLLSFSLIQS
jgi:hypothetical protein